jgi:hypothetical protein
MKAKVIADFRDAATWELHEAGTEYEGTGERIAELAALGFVESAKDEKPEGKTDEKPAERPKKAAPKRKAKAKE